MINTDLFNTYNSIYTIPFEGYRYIKKYIDMADAISRTTYKSIYIIDYYKLNLLYTSKNPFFMCTNAKEQDTYKSIFSIDRVAEADREMVLEASIVSNLYIKETPIEDRVKYKLSCNFHIADPRTNNEALVNVQMTPIRLNHHGEVWLALCVVSLAPGHASGDIIIKKQGNNWSSKYNRVTKEWTEIHGIELSETEKLVIILSNQGHSMKEIGSRICKSTDSVKGYRKSIFTKLGVDNIAEAITSAMLHQLI